MKTNPIDVPKVLSSRYLILRGILSLVFGIAVLLWPIAGMFAIALVYGAYAFADGVLTLASGVRRGRESKSWALPVLQGILGIGIGVITFFWPGITLLALSILVGVWAVMLGSLQIATATKLRKGSRVLLGIAGALSVLLGLGIFIVPPVGAVTLLTLVATYSVLSGGLLVWMGTKLRKGRFGLEPFGMDRHGLAT